MDRLIYTAMNGAQRILEQQDVITNNLANLSTSGFREQMAHYRSVPVVSEIGSQTRVATATVTPGSRFQPGAMTETGHALDVAISGEGWFAVRAPDGQEAYTRAGDLSVNVQNQLVTQSGLPVLTVDGQPVEVPDRGTVTFSSDGRLTALGAGDNPRDIQMVGQLKLVNPPAAELVRGPDGLFRQANGTPAPANPSVRMVSGFIEKSNVNPAEAMVAMIANSRRFESQMKIIQDASAREERANSILSFNG
ncbi:MAG TPA: flagellar basal-body rod protein FlgF [Alcaligenes sp.]|nr:flagellar basal-body rod protein FlgF [Alcaligenes sp.]HRL25930.1 flagellar basal-body rod protein FlgF [Alcaligenes sp.]